MTADIAPPAAAYAAWVDAEESLDYEHVACPRLPRDVAMTFTGTDGRPVTVWTDRPACARREMLTQPWRRVSEGRYVAVGYG